MQLARGEEMGRFKLGSTAIVLFGKEQVEWLTHWQAGQTIRLGEALACAHGANAGISSNDNKDNQ